MNAKRTELMQILGPGDAILTDEPGTGSILCQCAINNRRGFSSELLRGNGWRGRLFVLQADRLVKPAPNRHQTRTAS